MIRHIKICSSNITNLRLVYIVKIEKNKETLAEITLIGEEQHDLFYESIKEVQKYIPNYSCDDIENMINKMCQTSDTFAVDDYEFTISNDFDCVEYNNL